MNEQAAATKLVVLGDKIRAMEASGKSERAMSKAWKEYFAAEDFLKANYRGCR